LIPTPALHVVGGGYKRAFGEDVVPCSYEDVENSDLVVLVGSNAAWTHPVLYQRLVQAKHSNPEMKVVVIDPRRTATCDIADLHLALAPGSDAGLFVGLLNVIQGTDAWPMARVAAFCGLSPQDIGTFYDWFMTAPGRSRSTPWGSTSPPAAATSVTPSSTSILPAGNLTVRAAARFR
jgi:formylmethanofuran dehydrogenase subunit B